MHRLQGERAMVLGVANHDVGLLWPRVLFLQKRQAGCGKARRPAPLHDVLHQDSALLLSGARLFDFSIVAANRKAFGSVGEPELRCGMS